MVGEYHRPTLDPIGWGGIIWGLVQGFVQWQLKSCYAVSSINVQLSTVKVFAGLEAQAGGLLFCCQQVSLSPTNAIFMPCRVALFWGYIIGTKQDLEFD